MEPREYLSTVGVIVPGSHEWVVQCRPVGDNPVAEGSGDETPARGDNYSGLSVVITNGATMHEVDRVATVRALSRRPKWSFKRALKDVMAIAQAQCDALNESEAQLDDARHAANQRAGQDLLKAARELAHVKVTINEAMATVVEHLAKCGVDMAAVIDGMPEYDPEDGLA
jgi:predicted transcriptional regulator